MTANKNICLIHVTTVAIKPINDAFAQLWPEAKLNNLLDDSLATDLTNGISKKTLKERFLSLSKYAYNNGADAILFTCSAFGEILDECKNDIAIPILKPNEAMVVNAVQSAEKIALLATFEPAIDSIKAEFIEEAHKQGKSINIQAFSAPKALKALKEENDIEKHNQLVVELAKEASQCDIICFAQFSMSSALNDCIENSNKLILTTPESAVMKLKALLDN